MAAVEDALGAALAAAPRVASALPRRASPLLTRAMTSRSAATHSVRVASLSAAMKRPVGMQNCEKAGHPIPLPVACIELRHAPCGRSGVRRRKRKAPASGNSSTEEEGCTSTQPAGEVWRCDLKYSSERPWAVAQVTALLGGGPGAGRTLSTK